MNTRMLRKKSRASTKMNMWVHTKAILQLHLPSPSKVDLLYLSRLSKWLKPKSFGSFLIPLILFYYFPGTTLPGNSVLSTFKICTQSLNTFIIVIVITSLFTPLDEATIIIPWLLQQPPDSTPLCFPWLLKFVLAQ